MHSRQKKAYKKEIRRAKHILACILIMILLVSVSCASSAGEDTYSVPALNSENPNVVPWKEDAIQAAVENKTIRFYFMSGEKRTYSSSAGIKFGDSCLIAFPNGEVMLVDGGMPNYAPTLVENLRLLGISKVDHLVLSHMHDDHYGALLAPDGILAKFEIGKLYFNGIYNDSASVADRFDNAVAKYEIDTQILSQGDQLEMGDVHLDVYHPTAEEIGNRYEETALNNSSLVIKLTYGNFSALFAGDLYTDGEYRVLANNSEGVFDVDLLKANHHGRSTSNSKDWIRATTPRIVVATSGNPIDESPYAYYAKSGAYVFNDNLDGYVRVVSDGNTCSATTSRERSTTYFDKYDLLAQSVRSAALTVIQEDTTK